MRYLPVIFGVVLFIYGIIDCIRSESADVRSIPKPAWIIVILILPFFGVLLWFFFGRPQYSATVSSGQGQPAAPSRGYLAPDDDPVFLRNLEMERQQKAEAQRLAQLKADLEAREAKLREDHPNDESSSN